MLSSILDIHGEGMLGNGSFHSELVLLTLCSLEITCSFVFDSYHLYQTTAGRRYSYSVVVDVTGMHLDVLCLYMTGLHIFSLCSGFVCAESSITGMSLLGCLESYFPWCYFSPLMTVSALRSVQPFSRFSVALCTQSLMYMHMLMSIQIQIGAIALLNKEIFLKKLLTPKLKILIYIFMSFWTFVPFFFGSLAVLLNAIK